LFNSFSFEATSSLHPASQLMPELANKWLIFFLSFGSLIPSRGVAESWIFDIHLFVRSKSVWRYFVCVLLGVCVLKSSGFLKIIISDSSCHIPRYRSYRAFFILDVQDSSSFARTIIIRTGLIWQCRSCGPQQYPRPYHPIRPMLLCPTSSWQKWLHGHCSNGMNSMFGIRSTIGSG